MQTSPPLASVHINTADSGFYHGFSKTISITSKCLVGALILWAVAFPEHAGEILNATNAYILTNFAQWYIWLLAGFLVFCIAFAIWPAAASLKLGTDEDTPEFSYFSWISMMFGAGIGVGMLTWAIAEPVTHFANSPEVILGTAGAQAEDNLRNAFRWSFLHWGVHTWSCYALVGLSMAYFSYRRGLPLTIRSALTPLFGKRLEGTLGHVVDVAGVVATLLGAGQALGFGVQQFVSGLHRVGVGDWLLNTDGTASAWAIIMAITLIGGATIASAFSGVGKGIKWLSNLNMGLSIFLLSFFLIFGSTWFGLESLVYGLFDYVTQLPAMAIQVWSSGTSPSGAALATWQSNWTVFYFAWCVAFAPFVGMFLARISRGRTIREFIVGALIPPSLMSFLWFTWGGGTAIDLELSGIADGSILSVIHGDKIYAMVELLAPPAAAFALSVVIVVLLMTYLVTSADSAVLVVNTISAAGKEGRQARLHIVVWGVALLGMVGTLMLAGGLTAIQTTMVISALPFSVVMILMAISVTKAIVQDKRQPTKTSTVS
ncbi:MAG: BCCT family transporter [Pseudomonadota bacterium]